MNNTCICLSHNIQRGQIIETIWMLQENIFHRSIDKKLKEK